MFYWFAIGTTGLALTPGYLVRANLAVQRRALVPSVQGIVPADPCLVECVRIRGSAEFVPP